MSMTIRFWSLRAKGKETEEREKIKEERESREEVASREEERQQQAGERTRRNALRLVVPTEHSAHRMARSPTAPRLLTLMAPPPQSPVPSTAWQSPP